MKTLTQRLNESHPEYKLKGKQLQLYRYLKDNYPVYIHEPDVYSDELADNEMLIGMHVRKIKDGIRELMSDNKVTKFVDKIEMTNTLSSGSMIYDFYKLTLK